MAVHEVEQLRWRRALEERVAVLEAAVDARRDPELQLRIERGLSQGIARARVDLAVHLCHRGGERRTLVVGVPKTATMT